MSRKPLHASQEARSILITGAAGGIGTALAQAYAAPGVHLFLGDIQAAPLENLTALCQALGAEAQGKVVDVTHREAMAAWIQETDHLSP